jgi:hypothetical protein
MTNIIDSIIDYTLRSDSTTLNKLGNSLYVNRQMSLNREKFITKGIVSGSTNKMQDLLMEMKLLLNGRYAGNKDYLFERMHYLIDCSLKLQSKSKFTVNKKTVKNLKKTKMQKRCKKSGRFIAAKKRK